MMQIKLLYNYLSGNSTDDIKAVGELEKQVNKAITEIEKDKSCEVVDIKHFRLPERGYMTQITYDKSLSDSDE